MKPFEDQDLYSFPLTPDSVVVEIGGHDGNWLGLTTQKFDCYAHCYEPMPDFYNHLVRRFADNPKVRLWPFALGNRNAKVRFGVKGSMTSEFCQSENGFEEVPMRDFAEVMASHPRIDLLALNAEGSEFPILEQAIEKGLMRRIRHLVVQFHPVVENFQWRHDWIHEQLKRTHEQVFEAPWVWSGFSLKA